MSPKREPRMRKPPPPKLDRAVAMAIWVVSGLLIGIAVAIFVNGGIIWIGVGLLIGLLLAFRLTKPEQQVEDD